MGKKRVALKKIDKAAARHVSFSKRRKGLIKKAKELSVLCDAEIGLLVFSATGKLFEYSNTSMKMIFGKYCESFGEILNIELDNQDFGRMKQKTENINQRLRHMDGEDLRELTLKELQTLEQMLEGGLQNIRSTKRSRIEEENARLHLKVEQLKLRSNSENNTAAEFLLIEPSEAHDHPQSSGSIRNSCTSMGRHKTSTIQHNEVSDTSLQLGLVNSAFYILFDWNYWLFFTVDKIITKKIVFCFSLSI